ncbi:quinone oxidoreductase PIG3-like [Amphiura filiformis]|uniref:quinone oxidoreductase PIG3-like n=1 Tax=Amphiura filiformis TaxID=82378 RepID=UPI003B20D3FF
MTLSNLSTYSTHDDGYQSLQPDQGNSMRAAQFDNPGDPSVLYVGRVAIPVLKTREVLLQVKASAINRADTLQRRGRYDPPPGASSILGLEAAGIIHTVGPNCQSKWKAGDRVMALLPGGGNAEYTAVHEDHLMPIGKLKWDEAAAIPEVWLTAYQLLHFVGHMKRNDTVLIHSGGSGIGTAAVQLVKLAGGHPIVTAGSETKLAKAISLGAEAGFNYKQEDFAHAVLRHTKGKGVNIILDCVGGSHADKNLQAIALDGQWVLYGLLGGGTVEGPFLAKLLKKRVKLSATTLRARSTEYKTELVKEFSRKALPFFESTTGLVKLKAIIDKVFLLEKIGEAHQYMEDNKTVGKVVIKVCHIDSHVEL